MFRPFVLAGTNASDPLKHSECYMLVFEMSDSFAPFAGALLHESRCRMVALHLWEFCSICGSQNLMLALAQVSTSTDRAPQIALATIGLLTDKQQQ